MSASIRQVMAVVFLCLSTAALPAAAQDSAKARILILFDTSGSMTWAVDGSETNGDGSGDPWNSRFCCPGIGFSRLHIAKNAMTKMIDATGDIEFALMKFPQDYDPDQDFAVEAPWYKYNQEAGEVDLLRYQGLTGAFDAGLNLYDYSAVFTDSRTYLCETFTAGNADEIKDWFDNHEYESDGTPSLSLYGSPFDEPGTPDMTEQELRADGGTPLGEAINAAYDFMDDAKAADTHPLAACRPWYLLVLADGDYDGFIHPVTGENLGGGDAEVGRHGGKERL